ncbi:spermidine synthase [Aureococcus anophagefferens]|nr:spermidine synthase [Aureococcus anophagefferens]
MPEDQQQPTMTSSFWFDEEVTPDLSMRMRLKTLTFDEQSDFQRVQVIETAEFGTTLVLDGKTQSAKVDEYVYHECLVHPAMLLHGNPKRVYIGGGGELATARECLKHTSVAEVVMVDLDGMVAGPAVHLYTQEFYELVAKKLNPAAFLWRSRARGLINHTECFGAIHQTLKMAFPCVVPYSVTIPSFGSDWGFNVARRRDGRRRRERKVEDLDAAIAAKVSGDLQHYDGQSHLCMFNLIKTVRRHRR